MSSGLVGRLIVIGAILALPVTGYAQEAVVSGTVADSTGGVLPGVVVRALHEASGNTFEAVTDERGVYRIAVRIGGYRLTAELAGFTTVTQGGLELLVGQQAVVDLQMKPSALQESVTVTGEAPLIDTTSSTLASNIDSRQMENLPLNGRNWMDLSLLAAGSRQIASADLPAPLAAGGAGTYQINLDGQQVSQWTSPTFGQPRYSRDAIAEFEFVANRFDATQGRSSGVQVNAITKSGTNAPSGTVSGYFRHDRFNAADLVTKRVLPYQNQQISTTFGGPIRKDKIHFFGNYEYEREPQTFAFTTQWPRFNIDQSATRQQHMAGGRLDFQFSPRTHLTVRGAKYTELVPCDPRYCGGSIIHPSARQFNNKYSNDLNVALTQVLSNRLLNEVKVGYNGFYWIQETETKWDAGPPQVRGHGAKQVVFRGYTIGLTLPNIPMRLAQNTYSFRDDLTYSFTKGGRHDLKVGGEYLYALFPHFWCISCVGHIDAQGGPIPGNIEDLFPVWDNPSTWNLAALSPITRKVTESIGNFNIRNPRHVGAAWVQDSWTIARRLTLNLGVRYDVSDGLFAEYVSLPPFLKGGRPIDKNNLAPRTGFALSLNDRTVIRGGFGQYFSDITDQPSFLTTVFSQTIQIDILNDFTRPDFAANPFNGPYPTYDEAIRFWNEGKGVRRILAFLVSPEMRVPYSYQTSIGAQRQLGATMAVEADYVYTGNRQELTPRNINLAYNPATGVNYPFTDLSKRPYPQWGDVAMIHPSGSSSYHGLQTAFAKRFSRGWQASASYTLSREWKGEPQPLNPVEGCQYPMSAPGVCNVPFKVAPDLGGDSYWTGFTHRAVFNSVWELGYGFRLSGLYFYRNGALTQTTYGPDLRQTGALGAVGRLRPTTGNCAGRPCDGSIVPRNNFRQKPLHRVDLRLQRRFGLGGSAGIDGILEVFNVFNHANYGSYVIQEASTRYGQPVFSSNIAYQPRMLQLGFRFAF